MNKELGLAGGEVQVSYLITDETTLPLLGSYDTLVLEDSAGTTVFPADALFGDWESHQELTVVDARFEVQGLPTVPDLSHLSGGRRGIS